MWLNMTALKVNASAAFAALSCNATGLPLCTEARGREIFPNRSTESFYKCFTLRFVYTEYGRKLLHEFHMNGAEKHVRDFMRRSKLVRDAMQLMAERSGCQGEFCTPQRALLHALQRLAGPRRRVAPAREESSDAYVPGVVRVMSRNFAYPEHFDSPLASAWPCLREGLCPDDKPTSAVTEFKSVNVDAYAPLRKHSFAAAVILTLQAPLRDQNPSDLRLYRVRWPALLHNCSVRAASVVGVGVRFGNVNLTSGQQLGTPTLPRAALERPVDLRGNAGDLYVFNSEFVHLTPTIVGPRERIVVGAVAGFGPQADGPVDVWS